MRRKLSQHTEWLSLVETSGPFLSVSVLESVFPQGLEKVDTPRKQRLRSAYEEWRDSVDEDDSQLDKLHEAWLREVFDEFLEYKDSIRTPNKEEKEFTFNPIDHDVVFSPDLILQDSQNKTPLMFISVCSPDTDFEKANNKDDWPVSLPEKMIQLCRSYNVRLGMITNGEQWMLINAPTGSSSSQVSWFARLWFQEPFTLQAFQSLFGIRRFFGPVDEKLEALLEKSLEHLEEVTDTLGEQVKRAIEVLVQSLDRADQDRNRELLKDVSASELYEAGLTIMMRLVFILCAEERGLLLLGDPVYDQNYAIYTLRDKLADEADRYGPEILERRNDSWSRLLSVFRAIYGGVEHESLRIPALGGSLFDPDRFPFLEGRQKDTSWRDKRTSSPLPIDNRTVLLLLNSLQILEQGGGALLLSYKALDVEQIGHVYEGLLEYTVERLPDVTIGLIGSQKAKNPNLPINVLESVIKDNQNGLLAILQLATQRSESAIKNALENEVDDNLFAKLIADCGGDTILAERMKPFINLMRRDAWSDFIIYKKNSFAVVPGPGRRETGTHYTPKSLTETIVEKTLEPIVYIGPSEGKPVEEWKLKSPAELLNLKICDLAMGSGAFLVQACRWLAERLVEAWNKEEILGNFITIDGISVDEKNGDPMPNQIEDRIMMARRLIAEKCLYGVDVNPIAVELAKLSIWLVTLAKSYPFGFLDHNLKCGDSLLGIHRLDQLTKLNIYPDTVSQLRVFGNSIERAVEESIELRNEIRKTRIRDINDIHLMEVLNVEARNKISIVEKIADAVIGKALISGGNKNLLTRFLDDLAILVSESIEGNVDAVKKIIEESIQDLEIDFIYEKTSRKPLHWVLEFPEVFSGGGFDAIIGNPPFMGGQKISGNFGSSYREYLVSKLAFDKKGSADLCAYFFLRSAYLIKNRGRLGLLSTNTISQGNTREVGLDQLVEHGFIITSAIPSMKWPGKASLEIAIVLFFYGKWGGNFFLDGNKVKGINSYLAIPDQLSGHPYKLKANEDKSFQGSIVLGMGFILESEEALKLIELNPRNKEVLFPFLNGEDFNTNPTQLPSRWVINFFDWPLKRENLSDNWLEATSNQKKIWLRRGIVPIDYPDRVATDYPECLQIIEERVKPERTRKKEDGSYVLRKPLPQKWWIYAEKRPKLYLTISNLNQVVCIPETTKFLTFAFSPTNIVFSHAMKIIAFSSIPYITLLSSTIHQIWAIKYSSTLETRLKYITTDAFETFPFPNSLDNLSRVGESFFNLRQEIMKENQEGLTKTYNRFHNKIESSEKFMRLRDLFVEIDNSVASLYVWDDISLNHGFYNTSQGLRFTVSEVAKNEILQRLLVLNHKIFNEEQKKIILKQKKLNKFKQKDLNTEDMFESEDE